MAKETVLKHIALSLVTAAALSGCAFGITKDGKNPSESFTIPLSYQEAHRLADAQGRECEQAIGMQVGGAVYTDNQTAVVRFSSSGATAPLEQVDIKSTGAGQSQITVTVWGVGVWDQYEIAAMRKTLETGKIACRGDNRAWNKK